MLSSSEIFRDEQTFIRIHEDIILALRHVSRSVTQVTLFRAGPMVLNTPEVLTGTDQESELIREIPRIEICSRRF